MMMTTIVKAKLPGQMFCSSGGGRPAGFMASRYHHHHPYDDGEDEDDKEDEDGDDGCLPRWIHIPPPFLDLFQMFSRLLLEKQSVTGAPASAPISCIGRISGCTAGAARPVASRLHFTLSSCISKLLQLASGWPVLHWPALLTLAIGRLITLSSEK